MKIVTTVARVLLGLVFIAAGLSGFIFVIFAVPLPPQPPGNAATFQTVFFGSHYVLFVDAVQFLTGLFILINRFVPLALVTLAAVLANILVFHLTMMPLGIFPGLICTALWFIVAYSVRDKLAPLLSFRA